jgi:hypothetical protein
MEECLKTKLANFGRDCWMLLTEVPGWPDAPKKVRLRRALPILVPCVAMLLILAWNGLVRNPFIQTERASQRALLAQEQELDLLRMSVSEEQAGELAAQATQAERQILKDQQELGPILEDFKKQANDRRWEGNFQASDLSTQAAVSDGQLTFFPARAKLVSPAGNPEAFTALVALLDQLSASEKRIDLTRLSIRADEQGRYTAELNLRLVGRSPDEKTTQ